MGYRIIYEETVSDDLGREIIEDGLKADVARLKERHRLSFPRQLQREECWHRDKWSQG